MSYILDALKKAEHERTQQHSANTGALFSTKENHLSTAVLQKKIFYVTIVLLNALLVVGLLLFYKQPNEIDTPAPSNQPKAIEVPEEKPMPLVATEKNSIPLIIEKTPPHTTENKKELNNTQETLSSHATSLEQHAQLDPISPISAKISPTIKNSKLYFFNELPSNIQSVLPKLEINVHVYSAVPKQRFVLLNGKQYTEGMPIAKDLRVKEIQPDTVIFQYKAYTFKLLRP